MLRGNLFCLVLYLLGIRDRLSHTINIVEQCHEDDSIFKLFSTCIASVQISWIFSRISIVVSLGKRFHSNNLVLHRFRMRWTVGSLEVDLSILYLIPFARTSFPD